MGKRYTGTWDSTGTLEGPYKNRKTWFKDPSGTPAEPCKKTEPKPMTLEKLETVTLRKPGP